MLGARPGALGERPGDVRLDRRSAQPYKEGCGGGVRASRGGDVLKAIFTWWNGATIGVRFTIGRRGRFIGSDEFGNRYFEARDAKDSYDGRRRRWVIFQGYAEATKVPPDWHGWLHHTFSDPPTVAPLPRQAWETEYLPNLTGTVEAWRPAGSLTRTGERPPATGDYEAWRPE